MRIVRAEDEAEYGVALGSILVSLLEPEPGQGVAFHRWYERDHFYAGCMVGPWFFAGRRFVATRDLKALRYPERSSTIADSALGSYLALYWMHRDHHEAAERWAVDKVLWLGENGRMQGKGKTVHATVHASFYRYHWAACRDEDGVPPELGLDHPFAGAVMLMSDRPEGVSDEARDAWLLEEHLPALLPGSAAALCLSLNPLELPEDSPAYAPRPEGFERRSLQIYFLDEDPRACWETLFAQQGASFAKAGMGEVSFAAGFIPTIPGSDRYADEI